MEMIMLPNSQHYYGDEEDILQRNMIYIAKILGKMYMLKEFCYHYKTTCLKKLFFLQISFEVTFSRKLSPCKYSSISEAPKTHSFVY
jgi:hypothetical protein